MKSLSWEWIILVEEAQRHNFYLEFARWLINEIYSEKYKNWLERLLILFLNSAPVLEDAAFQGMTGTHLEYWTYCRGWCKHTHLALSIKILLTNQIFKKFLSKCLLRKKKKRKHMDADFTDLLALSPKLGLSSSLWLSVNDIFVHKF